jgi:hypothetical protein
MVEQVIIHVPEKAIQWALHPSGTLFWMEKGRANSVLRNTHDDTVLELDGVGVPDEMVCTRSFLWFVHKRTLFYLSLEDPKSGPQSMNLDPLQNYEGDPRSFRLDRMRLMAEDGARAVFVSLEFLSTDSRYNGLVAMIRIPEDTLVPVTLFQKRAEMSDLRFIGQSTNYVWFVQRNEDESYCREEETDKTITSYESIYLCSKHELSRPKWVSQQIGHHDSIAFANADVDVFQNHKGWEIVKGKSIHKGSFREQGTMVMEKVLLWDPADNSLYLQAGPSCIHKIRFTE